MAGGNLLEPDIASERGDLPFVLTETVGVHEHDGDAADAVALRAQKLGTHGIEVHSALYRAVGADALVHFGDAFVEHVRLDDVPGEDFRPCLVADTQRVAEAPGDQEECAIALALEQRVGRDGGTHLHRADARDRNGLRGRQPEQAPDALDRGIRIGPGIFRQQFLGREMTVRPPADHVGEGAAAVDPEIPASRRLVHGSRLAPRQ